MIVSSRYNNAAYKFNCQARIDTIQYIAMESERIASLIERLGNLLRAEERFTGRESRLQPIHLQILRYLSICNRYSDSPAGVTEFLGATKGTTSQSINVLVKKGYLKKQPDKEDGRKTHLILTPKAERYINNDYPPNEFSNALSEMDPNERSELSSLLNNLLVLIQSQNQGAAFGVCHTCRFFNKNGLGASHQCGLTKEPLTEKESFLICREHEYPQKKAV